MYKQLAALFARFAAAHLSASGKPHPIHDDLGRLIGALDIFSLREGRLRVAGWADAGEVILHMNGAKASVQPLLLRDDVAQMHGLNPQLGFDLTVPLGPLSLAEIDRFGLEIRLSDDSDHVVRQPLKIQRLSYVKCAIVFSFCAVLMGQMAHIFGWLTTKDPRFRTRIKQGMRLTALPAADLLDPDLFRASPDDPLPQTTITIVMPVFNAFDLLQESLHRIEAHTDLPWRMILIEDQSTDPRVLPYLRGWRSRHPDTVTLIENTTNAGFIRSVNSGLEIARNWPDPVILLNTDALVPADWASRMVAALLRDNCVATVTPMSNDAEIFTAPLICTPTPLTSGQGDAIDRVARTLNPVAEFPSLPTGVGFCMAISPRFLARLQQFDPVFGRGYGEEVDWCQKARQIGGKHVCATNLFVEHRGGQSFGSVEKQRLIARNNQKITQRYPNFDREVQRFVQSDPLKSTRLALAMAWIGAQDRYPVSIYIAHSMGGGAEAYLQDRIAKRHLAIGRSAIILRVGGKYRWQVELITPAGLISGQTDDQGYVLKLLKPVNRRRIIYSCAVGCRDPHSFPQAVLALADGGRHAIEVLFHDYFPISPSYTLLDQDGIFRSVPTGSTNSDPAHETKTASGAVIDVSLWQTQWGQLIKAAKDIIVFSRNSARIVSAAYPAAVPNLQIQPHKLLCQVPKPMQQPAYSRRVIGVLGDIGLQKGARLMGPLALACEQADIGLVIVGNFDHAFPLPPSVPVHGTYLIQDIARIVARYGITDWLIPSVWPETFSFTTHEALATGLPTHAFALGAQGDAVTEAPSGFAIPFETGADPQQAMIAHFQTYLSDQRRVA